MLTGSLSLAGSLGLAGELSGDVCIASSLELNSLFTGAWPNGVDDVLFWAKKFVKGADFCGVVVPGCVLFCAVKLEAPNTFEDAGCVGWPEGMTLKIDPLKPLVALPFTLGGALEANGLFPPAEKLKLDDGGVGLKLKGLLVLWPNVGNEALLKAVLGAAGCAGGKLLVAPKSPPPCCCCCCCCGCGKLKGFAFDGCCCCCCSSGAVGCCGVKPNGFDVSCWPGCCDG